MKKITAKALAQAAGGVLAHEGNEPVAEHISLDSRKMAGMTCLSLLSASGQTDMIISAWPSEMAQPLYLPAVIKPKRKYRKPFLPSVKVTKKKRQLQRQLPGSAFLIPEKHFRILELIAEETIRSR